MTRGSVAAKVREQKEAHPERYCSVKGCLWNTTRGPCKKHPHAPIHLGVVTIALVNGGEFSLPEPGE